MKTKLNEILEELKKPLSYKWKPQGQTKDKSKWQCVAYIDSRDVQNILDNTCVWENEFYEVKGKLFCRIGIHTEDGILWRSDSGFLENEHIEDGTESKGEVSDTFKRAAVQWGIGRFLYSKKIQWITSEEYDSNKYNLTEFIENKINGNVKTYNSKPKEEKKWFNIKEGDLDKIQDKLVESGKSGKDYIDGLIKAGYSLSKETKEQILVLG